MCLHNLNCNRWIINERDKKGTERKQFNCRAIKIAIFRGEAEKKTVTERKRCNINIFFLVITNLLLYISYKPFQNVINSFMTFIVGYYYTLSI